MWLFKIDVGGDGKHTDGGIIFLRNDGDERDALLDFLKTFIQTTLVISLVFNLVSHGR